MTKTPSEHDATTVRWTSPIVIAALGLSPAIVILALLLLNIPLGWTGKFTYRYSAIYILRLVNIITIAAPAILSATGILLVSGNSRFQRAGGHALCVAGIIGIAAWTWFAPPSYLSQHVLNFFSPSHDGAFVLEAFEFDRAREYLAHFPERAATPPAVMKGTRVISNPPGTTMIAYGVRRFLEATPSVGAPLEQFMRDDGVEKPIIRQQMAVGIVTAWVLLTVYVLGAICLYFAAALRLSAPAAWAVATIVATTPAMLLFSPGKDPAQLFTIALPLLLWMAALRKQPVLLGALAGFSCGLGVLMSLVHVWVAAIITIASWAAEFRENQRRLMIATGGAICGFVVFAIGVYWLASIDLVGIARAVAAAQSRVTRGPDSMPLIGQLLGLPIFLLFIGAGPFVLAWTSSREPQFRGDADARLGMYVVAITALLMLATIGFTNAETPRLWIPFVVLITFGVALRIRRFRSGADAKALAILVLIHILCAAVVWSLMDMREAEMRLMTKRILN